MSIDELIEESEDLHADAMRSTNAVLDEFVEHGQDRRAHGGHDLDEIRADQAARSDRLTKGLAATAVVGGFGIGAALLGALSASPAFADTASDVAAAQTAASIENLAIAVYTKAAGLSVMQGIAAPAGPTITAFVTKTISQHKDHAAAFNGASARLGGKQQTGIDTTVYNAVVTPTLPTLTSPLKVVQFAAELEMVAAETYLVQTAAVGDSQLRSTFSSIMGVEAQHQSILLAVAALLQGGAPQLIKIGDDPAALPQGAGSVGFPNSFYKTDMARPATEGAVK